MGNSSLFKIMVIIGAVFAFTAIILAIGGALDESDPGNSLGVSPTPTGSIITLRTNEVIWKNYDMYLIIDAVAAVSPEAREFYRIFKPDSWIWIPSEHQNGAIRIDSHGTQISDEAVSEFDVYASLISSYGNTIFVGFNVNIQQTMTADIEAPYSGTVKASDNWSEMDGISVEAGEILFSIETTAELSYTLEVADIIEANLPNHITRTKLF